MNCRRINELIPLFIGGDLDAEAIKDVSLHMGECETCRALVEVYGESQSWFQSQMLPELDEAFYEGLQQSVLRKIAQTQSRPSLFRQLIENLRLRPIWATASVILVFAVVVAMFLYSGRTNRNFDPNQIVKTPAPKESPGPQEPAANSPQPSVERPYNLKNYRSVGNRHPRRVKNLRYQLPQVKQDKADDTGIIANDTFPEPSENILNLAGENSDASLLEGGTRMELQTSDPNIRIIWFAPKLTPSTSVKIDTE